MRDSKTVRVAVYARVSKNDDTQNPETQLQPLRQFVQARGWQVTQEYVDRCSGATDNRPALRALIADLRQRKADVLLFWKLDRVGRSLQHLVNFAAELRALGVQLVSLTEGFDTTTPAGRAMVNMLGVLAEFERDIIIERTRAGLQRAKREGKRLGRAPAVFDHARARRLHKQGLSLRAIAAQLGLKTHRPIQRLLARGGAQ